MHMKQNSTTPKVINGGRHDNASRQTLAARRQLGSLLIDLLRFLPQGWCPGEELRGIKAETNQEFAIGVILYLGEFAYNNGKLSRESYSDLIIAITAANNRRGDLQRLDALRKNYEALAKDLSVNPSKRSLTPIEAACAATWGNGGVA